VNREGKAFRAWGGGRGECGYRGRARRGGEGDARGIRDESAGCFRRWRDGPRARSQRRKVMGLASRWKTPSARPAPAAPSAAPAPFSRTTCRKHARARSSSSATARLRHQARAAPSAAPCAGCFRSRAGAAAACTWRWLQANESLAASSGRQRYAPSARPLHSPSRTSAIR